MLPKAVEWRRQLDGGEVESQAAIAGREGITRARVCQVMSLLRLAPTLQRRILAPSTDSRENAAEHTVRHIARIGDRARQLKAFHQVRVAT